MTELYNVISDLCKLKISQSKQEYINKEISDILIPFVAELKAKSKILEIELKIVTEMMEDNYKKFLDLKFKDMQ